jgi:hypothetical protein
MILFYDLKHSVLNNIGLFGAISKFSSAQPIRAETWGIRD